MILRKYVVILLVILFTLSLAGFTQTPALAATLEAPTNGSSVSSLTPAAATGTIVVNATLDGAPWSGGIEYIITGPKTESGSSVTQSFSDLPAGTYAVTYISGGPADAPLVDISPSPVQALSAGYTVTFTLNFFTRNTGAIVVRATLDGSPWSGPLYFAISGTKGVKEFFDNMVPRKFYQLPAGVYTASRSSNGPAGSRLDSITSSPTQDLSTGGIITFTFNFITIDES